MVYFTQCVKFCKVNPEICKLQQVLHSLTVGISDGDEWWKYPEYHLKHTHTQVTPVTSTWVKHLDFSFGFIKTDNYMVYQPIKLKKGEQIKRERDRQTDRQRVTKRETQREKKQSMKMTEQTDYLVYSSYWQEWEYRFTEEGWNPQDTVVLLVLDRLH